MATNTKKSNFITNKEGKPNFRDNSQQREFWSGSFGNSYIDRNYNLNTINKKQKKDKGITTEEILYDFFNEIDRKNSILELGCNVGLNLGTLKKIGFSNLTGLDINKKSIEIAQQKYPNITFINSSIEEYHNIKQFDLVFTVGVLIHINPRILNAIIQKIISLTHTYVFGLESYADKLTTVNYRGNQDRYWKQNFSKLYLQTNKLEIIKEKKIRYKNNDLVDTAYLLKKVKSN